MFILIPHPGDHPMFKSYLTVGILSFLEYVMVITIMLWRHFTQKPPRFPDDFKCKWKNPRPKFTRTTVHCNTNIYWFNVTPPIKLLFLDCNSDNSICHQSLIQPLSSKSSSVLLVEKLVPPHHWLQRSVHSVSPQRRSVTISAKLLVTGKDSKSQSSLPFKTDRLRYVKNHILIEIFYFWPKNGSDVDSGTVDPFDHPLRRLYSPAEFEFIRMFLLTTLKVNNSGLCCSICLFYDHQGPQRTTTWQKEGQEQ